MKPQAALAAIAALILTVAAGIAPAFAARSSYVIDDAHLLSQTAIAQINQQVGDFNAQTGKEVVVVTTDSLNGTDANAATERSFAQQQVNGVLIFIAKNEKQIKIAGDTASRQFFPSGSFNGDLSGDAALVRARQLRPRRRDGREPDHQHLPRARLVAEPRPQPVVAASARRVNTSSSGGFGLGFIWWIIILAVIFFVIRGIFSAMSGPRMYGGGGARIRPGRPGLRRRLRRRRRRQLLERHARRARRRVSRQRAVRQPRRRQHRRQQRRRRFVRFDAAMPAARPTPAAGRATPARSTLRTSAAAAGATRAAAAIPAAAGAAATAAGAAATPAAAGSVRVKYANASHIL